MNTYIITPIGNRFAVFAEDGVQPLTTHRTRADAARQVGLFKASDNRREGRAS